MEVVENETSENQRNKYRKQHLEKPKKVFSTCAHICENGEGVIQVQGNSWSLNSWSDSALPEQLILISWSLCSSLWLGDESFSQVVDELSHHSFTILPRILEAVEEAKCSRPCSQWCRCVLRAPWLPQYPIEKKKEVFCCKQYIVKCKRLAREKHCLKMALYRTNNCREGKYCFFQLYFLSKRVVEADKGLWEKVNRLLQ